MPVAKNQRNSVIVSKFTPGNFEAYCPNSYFSSKITVKNDSLHVIFDSYYLRADCFPHFSRNNSLFYCQSICNIDIIFVNKLNLRHHLWINDSRYNHILISFLISFVSENSKVIASKSINLTFAMILVRILSQIVNNGTIVAKFKFSLISDDDCECG